jgi:hypothetical protein
MGETPSLLVKRWESADQPRSEPSNIPQITALNLTILPTLLRPANSDLARSLLSPDRSLAYC